MNVFIIPSWYPSATNPTYGIFIKEQLEMMAQLRPDWNIGVSLWGQGDFEKLVWVKDHFRNMQKFRRHTDDRFIKKNKGNLTEYYQPALSWTKKFRKGNLNEIVRCNELNFQHFVLEFGPPDVIMVQASYPGSLIGHYISKKYNIPYIVHVRMGGFMFDHLLSDVSGMKDELLNAINSADQVLVTSDFQGQGLQQWIPKADVIHNPVDFTFFQPSKKSENYIVSIGRFEEEKGFDLLIETMKDVPNFKLKIGGSGSEEKKLKQQVEEYQLQGSVEFLGELDRVQIKNVISNCKFLVLPSRYETFGNVLLEAMACGKPVVATKCGGPEEIVSEKTGYLCDVSGESLSQSISEMNLNIASFNTEEIRKEAELRFSPEVWIEKMESFFKEKVSK